MSAARPAAAPLPAGRARNHPQAPVLHRARQGAALRTGGEPPLLPGARGYAGRGFHREQAGRAAGSAAGRAGAGGAGLCDSGPFSRRAVLLSAAGGVHGQVPAVPAARLHGEQGGSFAGGALSGLSDAPVPGGVHLDVGCISPGAGASGVPRGKALGLRVEKCQDQLRCDNSSAWWVASSKAVGTIA